MNKIKYANTKGSSQLIIKSLKGQQVSENEIFAINAGKVSGLLHVDIVRRGSSFKLIYNVTGFLSLKDYLNTPLNKLRFAQVLQNILSNLKAVESSYFNRQYLLMDVNQVYVNPSSQDIYFVYVPIQMFESGTSLKDFLLSIIQYCTFVADENNSYVRDYITILNSDVNFSVFELEQYVDRLLGQNISRVQEKQCPKCKAPLKAEAKYCPNCGAKPTDIGGSLSNSGKGVYDPLADIGGDIGLAKEAPKEEVNGKDNTQGLSDGTIVLNSVYGETTVFVEEEPEPQVFAYLIRKRTEEKIPINKSPFRIGVEKTKVDYFVDGNNTVSRSHADILMTDNRYFIVDLHSTNKTYVDGRIAPVESEVELFDGARVRLSNEEFVFYIETTEKRKE